MFRLNGLKPMNAIVNAPVQFPSKMKPFAFPSRYKVARGGRSSAKSWTIAAMLIMRGAEKQQRFLCTREIQKSIGASVLQLLSDTIDRLGYSDFYTVQANKVIGINGTTFIFEGLKSNVNKIKSMEGIDICWVEEAEKVTDESWRVLIPTIRKSGSEIWVSYNPDLESDPTHQRFIVNPPENTVSVEINYLDNRFCPDESIQEANYLKRVDYEAFENVWLGKCRKSSEAEIFKDKWIVDDFNDHFEYNADISIYYGADWGLRDPNTLLRMFIHEKTLYISHEFYKVGIDLKDLADHYDNVPDSRNYKIRADCSRPETISYMKSEGFKIEGAKKWAGSIEDGIAYMRQFEKIVIHSRCVNTINEFRNYRYKVDKLTGDILPVIVDKHNHAIDAIRYGLEPLISRKRKKALIY